MTLYRGFALGQATPTSNVTTSAQKVREAGAWNGCGFVGSMPDRASAKLYVDWLHGTDPDHASINTLEDVEHGHSVILNGRLPPENARMVDRLDGIVDWLEANGNEAQDLEYAFKELVGTTNQFAIAADQRAAARALGDFFYLEDPDMDGRTRLHLRRGSDRTREGSFVASGIGDGWIRPLVEHLSKTSMGDLPTLAMHVDAPAYARHVFVEGPEPSMGKDAIDRLKDVADALSNVMNRWPSDPGRTNNVVYALHYLRAVLETVRPVDTAPSMSPVP